MKFRLSWYHRATGGMPQSAEYDDIGLAQQQFQYLARNHEVHGLIMTAWNPRGV